MEYKTIFGEFDWDTVRRGKFQGKSGTFMSIARIIYNGLSYNFGSQDGAVTIMNQLTTWRFIAPVGRFDMTDYADLSLADALKDVAEDTKNVPIPAWDEFFSFLGGREDLVNAAIQPYVIFIGGVKVDLPFLQSCSTFFEFMSWLLADIGEAGNLPASAFIEGQDMFILMEEYSAMPTSITLKTPTIKPTYSDDINLLSGYAYYGKQDAFAHPVFMCDRYIYAYEETTFYGVAVPQGWSIMEIDSAENISFAPYDMDANPVTIALGGEAVEVNYIAKLFMDIEYDLSTAVKEGEILYVFRA